MANKIFEEFGKNPLILFGKWLSEAEKSEPNDPNAMALATVDNNGRPAVRMVLLKSFDERGFIFFTNYESAKGQALLKNPYAELNFHWKSLQKQIRISGSIEKTSAAEADEYFASRSRMSQLGAAASAQSRNLESYENFEGAVKALDQKYKDQDIPRPSHWGGFRVIPEKIEFWIGHPQRLHKRFVYARRGEAWDANWLYP